MLRQALPCHLLTSGPISAACFLFSAAIDIEQPQQPAHLLCRLVMPRPDGRRCLVIASNCWTVSRLRTGRVLHSFPSPLPGGSTASSSGADSFSILDCVFHGEAGAKCSMEAVSLVQT